ncbi:MAG: AAA family ATPase [Pseudomonadota bacterium]
MSDAHRITSIHERANATLERAFEMLGEFESRELDLKFSLKKAADMVGRSEMTIRRAEEDGSLPPPTKSPISGKRTGYTLEDVNKMRIHFGTAPRRNDDEDPIVIGVQNFKGGVAKTTVSVHASQYFAMAGYRTLLIDADPQASATSMMGLYPDRDVSPDDTLRAFLEGYDESLGYAIKATHWDGLDLIPSDLSLYNAEYVISDNDDVANKIDRFEYLRPGVTEIAKAYDVVIIDPPPALGMISLNVLRAINALLIPVPPSTIDYASTVSFLFMLRDIITVLEARGRSSDYKFIRMVATKLDENQTVHREMREMMEQNFGAEMLPNALITSSVYNRANANMCSVYELDLGADKTYKRCRVNLDRVLQDLELEVRKQWKSQKNPLRAAGMA